MALWDRNEPRATSPATPMPRCLGPSTTFLPCNTSWSGAVEIMAQRGWTTRSFQVRHGNMFDIIWYHYMVFYVHLCHVWYHSMVFYVHLWSLMSCVISCWGLCAPYFQVWKRVRIHSYHQLGKYPAGGMEVWSYQNRAYRAISCLGSIVGNWTITQQHIQYDIINI